MTVFFRYAARSDVGLMRANNQDSGYAGPNLLMIADGMGGHAGGDVASSLAVAGVAQLDGEGLSGDLSQHLERAILEANDNILAHARSERELAGMGTTVTAIFRNENRIALAHIGDSRGYLLRNNGFTQVTTDHTFVQRLIAEGRITAEEAERHPQRNVILKVLGDVESEPLLDLSTRATLPGDRWLLCSDGLSGVVSEGTIAKTLQEHKSVDECADELIRLALKGGGPDNITVVVAEVCSIDDLRAGEKQSTAPEVVGAAALDRKAPTRATGAAARMAALQRRRVTIDDDDDGIIEELPQRRRWTVVVAGFGLLILGVLVGALGYRWTQSQFYVGVESSNVAIYQGVPQKVLGLSFSHLVSVEDLTTDVLPSYMLQQLQQNHYTSSSYEGAQGIVANIRGAAEAAIAEEAKRQADQAETARRAELARQCTSASAAASAAASSNASLTASANAVVAAGSPAPVIAPMTPSVTMPPNCADVQVSTAPATPTPSAGPAPAASEPATPSPAATTSDPATTSPAAVN
ncbi:Stp1/IreP family PP2C-type Ser/Thr phosphatase [Micrococcales bacterium 31B]|nr:Stp1/IreP family PP2C-type Ser/Thr phosphatase [Micrococcales bacterium 31B]